MAANPNARRDSRKYGTSSVRIKNYSVCHYCGSSPLKESDHFCPACGFPQRGTEADQKRFLIGKKFKAKDQNESGAEIFIARIILFLLGGICLLASYFASRGKNEMIAVGILVLGLVYIGLAIWAGKQPLPALMSGLILYVTILVVSTIIQPESLFQMIIIKGIIISGLIYGVSAVKKYEDRKKELEIVKMDLTKEAESQNENGENPVS